MCGWRHILGPGGGDPGCCSSKHTSKKKLRRAANTSSHDPCTQSNPAYELHKPRKRTIPMKQNIAYEQHTPSS